jgi:tetratricopeptide (TPR) repeat protein
VRGQLMTRFAFRHVLIQKYLYQRLGRGERAYLHEATGLILERIYADSDFPPASELARHFVEAGMPDKAAVYLQQAGEQALKVSAYPEAVAHLMQAREMAPRAADGDALAVSLGGGRLERLLGEAHYGMGDLTESVVRLELAASLLGKAIPRGRRRVVFGLGVEVLTQALHLLFGPVFLRRPKTEQALSHEAAVTFKLLAEIYLVQNETLRTVYATVRGLNLAEKSGVASDLARAYADSTVIAPLLGLARLGERYRRRALHQVESEDGRSAKAYVELSTSIFTLGEANWEAAIESLESANRVHEQAGDWNRLAVGLMLLANYYSLRGENEQSLETYLELCSLAERSGNTQHQAWGIDGRAKCLIRRGLDDDYRESVKLLQVSLDQLAGEGMHQEEVEALGFLAYANWCLGSQEEALSAAEKATSILARSAPNFFSQVEGYAAVVRTLLSAWESGGSSRTKSHNELQNEVSIAVRALDRLASTFPVCGPRADIWHAWLDWTTGRRSRARARWQRGLEKAMEQDMPYERALAHLEIARHLPARDGERARHIQIAADLFASQSAFGELADVRSLEA